MAVCQIFCVMLLQGPQSQLQLQILFVGGIDLYQMANYCLYMGDNLIIILHLKPCNVFVHTSKSAAERTTLAYVPCSRLLPGWAEEIAGNERSKHFFENRL